MKLFIELARRTAGPVGRLDSLLTALSAGGRDGHGAPIWTEQKLRERMAEALGDARVAIELAQHWLAEHPPKKG